MDADYSDHLGLLSNAPTQTWSLLHNLEQAAKGIGFYVNTDKTWFMSFKQVSAITFLNSKPLK